MTRNGLFLDFDGTLVKSHHLIKESYYDILNVHGKVGSDEDFQALSGPPTRIFIQNVLNKYDLPTTIDALIEQFDKNLRKSYQNISPIENALNLIKTAARQKWIIGIITSNNRNLVEQWLHENTLTPYVSFIVDGESTAQGKPNPEPYLKALDLSHCIPENSIAVEDSIIGASSALAAGLSTFFLASSVSFSQKEDIVKNFPSLKIISNLKEVINWIS